MEKAKIKNLNNGEEYIIEYDDYSYYGDYRIIIFSINKEDKIIIPLFNTIVYLDVN